MRMIGSPIIVLSREIPQSYLTVHTASAYLANCDMIKTPPGLGFGFQRVPGASRAQKAEGVLATRVAAYRVPGP